MKKVLLTNCFILCALMTLLGCIRRGVEVERYSSKNEQTCQLENKVYWCSLYTQLDGDEEFVGCKCLSKRNSHVLHGRQLSPQDEIVFQQLLEEDKKKDVQGANRSEEDKKLSGDYFKCQVEGTIPVIGGESCRIEGETLIVQRCSGTYQTFPASKAKANPFFKCNRR